jgi:hypothetical protein
MAMSPVKIENYVSGGGGISAGGAFGAAMISQGIMNATISIMQGRVTKAQADYNASILEGKAQWNEFQKGVAARQFDRTVGQIVGQGVARTAGAGLKFSGSPMAVMIDTVTQIKKDKAITLANIEQERIYNINAANMSRAEGKIAKSQAPVNALSEILKAGSNYAMYRGLNISQGSTRAGKQ